MSIERQKQYSRIMLGKGGVYAKHCFDNDFIGVHFGIDQDLRTYIGEKKREFHKHVIPVFLENCPDKTTRAAGLACGMFWTVMKGMEVGDVVLSPDGEGAYRVGIINGEYYFKSKGVLPHRRSVQWAPRNIERKNMSSALRYATGSIGAVSNISQYSEEIEQLVNGTASLELVPNENRTEITREDTWSEEELLASVEIYKKMYQAGEEGRKIIKVKMYRELEERFGRSHKAFERRMQNISHVVQELGGSYVVGLKPLSHIGKNVEPVLIRLVNEAGFLATEMSTSELDIETAELQASELIRELSKKDKEYLPPRGLPCTTAYTLKTTQRKRSPQVKAWIIHQAGGICELCRKKAPFVKDDNSPYLEVHHVVRLADDGSDTVDNAVAVCPNCHRALHLSRDKNSLVEKLYEKIDRLIRQ